VAKKTQGKQTTASKTPKRSCARAGRSRSVPRAARPVSVGAQLRQDADRELADRGHSKLAAGEKPTRAEALAIERVDALEIDWAWEIILSRRSAKKYAARFTGRQHKTLDEWSVRYGLPVGGADFAAAELGPAMADCIARIGKRNLKLDPDEAVLYGPDTPQLERLRAARASIAELDLAKARRDVVDRAMAHECLGRIAARSTRYGETIQQTFGEEALRMFHAYLDDVKREIDGTFAE